MKFKRFALASWLALGFAMAPSAQSSLDPQINEKIRREEAANSQIMKTLHHLADVYGPRLTGSPNHKAAAEWAVRTMGGWGMQNGHLEPWDFGHSGWLNEHLEVHAVSPFKDALVVEALAWTPGTNGRTRGTAFNLVTPQGPTDAELTAYLASAKDKVHRAAVLVGKPVFVPVNLTPAPVRWSDEQIRCRFDESAAADPACAALNQGRGGARGGGGRGPGPQADGRLTARQVSDKVDAFLVANKAILRVNDAGRPHGQIIAFNNTSDDVKTMVPTVVMRNEDYGRIARILADGTPVELEANIVNTVYPEGKTSYNAVAEIAGGDKKDEVVMAGGHLDSWHSATGATDNAIGCSIMMEAARVLKALGVQPRRTIRIALWSGEEAVNMLRGILAPFKDLKVAGVIGTESRATGGTDVTSFNNAGLPGIGFAQDTIEYGSHTHHTNLDTYERVIEEEVRDAAVVVAATLYDLAMRNEPLPRFAADKMPAPPQRGRGDR